MASMKLTLLEQMSQLGSSIRSNSYRVESLTHSTILVSAEVFDDGRVQLLESTSAALIITEGEREAFGKCLKKYGTADR